MTTYAGDASVYPAKGYGSRDYVEFRAKQVIGASGAVGTLTKDDPQVTVAKNAGTGTYDITFPKCTDVTILAALVSAAGTVKTFWLAAQSATAGTAQLVTGNGGGTATNPASADEIHLVFKCYTT